MAVLSVLRGALVSTARAMLGRTHVNQARQMSDHRVMNITASRFQWNKFKDMLHLYVVGAAAPLLLGVFVINCTIGPATLTELPDSDEHVPEEWEYYKSPVTRFFVRYMLSGEQKVYEKNLQYIWETYHQRDLVQIEREVRALMRDRQDYKAWYYQPFYERKYHRIVRNDLVETTEQRTADAAHR